MSTTYVITWGDTLGEIAKRHNVTTKELAQVNGFADPDRIYVGQQLIIPAKRPEWRRQVQPAVYSCRIVDPNWHPIANLRTRMVVDGKDVIHTTDADGCLPLVEAKQADKPVQIHVAKRDGGEKHIQTLQHTPGKQRVTLVSPTLKVETKSRPHEGPAHPSLLDTLISKADAAVDEIKHVVKEIFVKPEVKPGQTAPQRNEKGHPVETIVLQCPNPHNLDLGSNYIYSNAILTASSRSGIIPQAIAALIDAEAGRDKNGVWNRYATNSKSSARGMTQFLRGTWLSEALRAGTYLHEQAFNMGLVDHYPGKGFCVSLSSGKHLSREYIDKHNTAWIEDDANGKKLLDLRNDPMFAINAAVDYGMANLKALAHMGFKLGGLNDGEKAKLLYLTHHLGSGDAKGFINATITESRAKKLLITQVGPKEANKKAKDLDGRYVAAHREWLIFFIDVLKIRPREYCCDKALIPTAKTLPNIITSIGGKLPK